jgi:4-diphosphocytidyl-2-C-methyl-D-erythritol kinase
MDIAARAKLNLYLHVTGRRPDGYHILQSLVAFADTGDLLTFTPGSGFSLDICGPFAGDAPPGAGNIVTKAVLGFAAHMRRAPDVHIRLEKNLPAGAGLGGGSADAAAAVRGLLDLWELSADDIGGLDAFLLSLGADVPVCFHGRMAHMGGIGEDIRPVCAAFDIPLVMAHPGEPCRTAQVFRLYNGEHSSQAAELPPRFETMDELLSFLEVRRNDLSRAAGLCVPTVKRVLVSLDGEEGCLLARMSGSGSACFGLFSSMNEARQTAQSLKEGNPGWWVSAALIEGGSQTLRIRQSG